MQAAERTVSLAEEITQHTKAPTTKIELWSTLFTRIGIGLLISSTSPSMRRVIAPLLDESKKAMSCERRRVNSFPRRSSRNRRDIKRDEYLCMASNKVQPAQYTARNFTLFINDDRFSPIKSSKMCPSTFGTINWHTTLIKRHAAVRMTKNV